MKSALILLIAGLCGANHNLFTQEGQEFVYEYSGRMLTGIPQLDSTFAGMSLKSKMYVQVTAENYYKIQLKDVKYGTFNEKLTGPKPENWRSVELESSTELTGEVKQWLETPFEIKMVNGDIEYVKISTTEPQWCVNMKKALISTLKIQFPTSSNTWSSSESSRQESPRFSYVKKQQYKEGESPLFWTVMEEGIEGKCENTYQVSELPEYMIHDYEKGMINSAFCEGKKYFQVLRTRDITKCTEKNIFLSSKGHKNCLVGNCESENTKQTQTRFYACADSVTEIPYWHGVINEGEMVQNVIPFNTEPVVTGTKQVVKLMKVGQVSHTMPEVPSPKVCNDLSYEFPVSKSQSSQITSRQSQMEFFQALTKQSEQISFIPAIFENLNTEELYTQIVEKLVLVSQQLHSTELFAEKEIPSQLKALKTIVSVLKTSELKKIWQSVQSLSATQEIKQTVRNLFIDIVRNSGSSPCVMFILDLVKTNQLTEIETYYIIVTTNHYIKTPTEELIHQIFLATKSPAVQEKFWLKGSAHLTFANLVRNACLGSAKSYYPEDVFGKMCTTSNKKIVQEYVPYLVQELKSATTSIEKQIALWSLGQLSHESVLPTMINYMEGKTEDSTNQLRKVALYALSDVAHQYSHKLVPVFLAIATNPAEARNLRIAAISMLMKCQPETVYLQKLAVMTWFEQDLEVSRFIYSMLKEQSKMELESIPEGSYLRELCLKAKTVFPLCKPMKVVIGVNKIYSGYLKELQIGSYMLNSIMSGSQSTEIYHKTEYFLKQAQTTPLEFSLHFAGLKTVVRDLLSSISPKSLHPQLKEVIEKLGVSSRQDAQFEVGAWMRLSDDINFAVEMNHENVKLIRNKVLLAMKDSGMSLMDKICGKTSVNHQNVFEDLPYQALVPSDLGLPIVVESQITYLYSVKGFINIECSFTKPSVTMEVSNKMAYTYNGYAGTVCPFTQEMLVAGINIHRANNMPVKTLVEVEPKTSQLKISMTKSEQVQSSSKYVDIHHYQVTPYTAKKPLIFQDLTPAVLHHNTKIIRSKSSQTVVEGSMGQWMGLDLSAKVETECDLYDTKTLMDSWSIYNYNPIAKTFFHFTETALTSDGMPSARYHKYTFVYNPSTSTTEGAEMTVKLSLAQKEKNQVTKKINYNHERKSLESNHLRESDKTDIRLNDCLRKLEAEVGYAINALVSAQFIGGEQKTYTYSITAAGGKKILTHKWNLHFENEQEQSYLKNLCVNGQMQYPSSWTSDAKFMYSNKVAFGQTCDQHFINIEGQSQVSEEQKRYSQMSEESILCQSHSVSEEKYRLELSNCRDSELERKQFLEKKHSETVQKKLESCEKKRLQSVSLDQTVFTVTYSQSLPKQVFETTQVLNTMTKAVLFPYIFQLTEAKESNKVVINMKINQKVNTVTIEVMSPEETIVFKNIRLPEELRQIVPLVSGQSPLEQSYKALTGTPLYGKCVLGQGYVHSFDQKTYNYQIDECDHLITSDCSKDQEHAVLAKEVNGLKHVTVFESKTKIELRPAQAYQNYVEDWTCEVNGQKIYLNKNEMKTIKIESDSLLKGECTIFWHSDNVVEINTPHTRITHKGKTISLEEKSLMADGSHCGLCGDYSMVRTADIKSPKECVLSSDKLSAYSYRVKSNQCKPLPESIFQKIKSEEEKCSKHTTKSTEVSSVYRTAGQDMHHKLRHSVIVQEDKVCISKQQLVNCINGSYPKEQRRLTMSYVCFPEGGESESYKQRCERGENLVSELWSKDVSFTTGMERATSCVHRN